MCNINKLLAVDLDKNLIEQTVVAVRDLIKNGEDNIVVIFPNRRAVRFFEKQLDGNLFLNVNAYSFPDFIKNTFYNTQTDPPFYQYEIDRYFTILSIIKNHNVSLYEKLGGIEDRVFPWCIRISSLFNELDRELIESVTKFEYVDNVVNEAKEILNNLDNLYKEYKSYLNKKKVTFSGDLFKRFSQTEFNFNCGFVFSGFSFLSNSEKKIIDNIRETNNTVILFQTDLQNRHKFFYPYEIYENWLDGSYWNVKPEHCVNEKFTKTDISFFEAFDTHSSCDFLTKNLKKSQINTNNPLETGVVLCDENSLFPVLYSIPKSNVNITMGITFNKTAFAKLINNLIEIAMTTTKKGYYHKPLLKLLDNSLLYGFKCEDEEVLNKLPVKLANYIEKNNIAFFSFDSLKHADIFADKEKSLLNYFNNNLLVSFINGKNLADIGKVLLDFLNSVKDYLSENENLLFEKQIALNFTDNVLIKLLESKHSKQNFTNKQILYRVLKHITEQISVNFEGNPLSGIQIMGVLEARLLKFNTLHILDVNEGIMPPDNKIDPLIPTAIKKSIGLQTYKLKEKIHKYNFFRLVDSCKNVNIYYQKGETSDEKKVRSRFIEQLLVEMEKQIVDSTQVKTVGEVEKELIKSSSVFVKSHLKQDEFEKIIQIANVNLEKDPISASKINDFIACPLRFYFSSILKIQEETKIEEGQNAKNVGIIIHNLLENGFKPYLNKQIDYSTARTIKQNIMSKLQTEIGTNFNHLSQIRIKLLGKLAEERLDTFFKKTYSDITGTTTTLVGIEKKYMVNFGNYKLKGFIDRVDYIEDNVNCYYKVIDYKTGKSTKTPTKKLGSLVENFDFEDYSKENQLKLYEQLHSIQLPLYNYFLCCKDNIEYENIVSAIYMLGVSDSNKQESNFDGSLLSKLKFEQILKYILTCMADTKYYFFQDTKNCCYCSHYKTCIFTSHKSGY